MDWAHPSVLLAAPPALALLWWLQRASAHPMGARRRHALLAVRSALLVLVFLALAGVRVRLVAHEEAVIFVLDHSQSQGERAMAAGCGRAGRLARALPRGTQVGFVSAGSAPVARRLPARDRSAPEPDPALMETLGAQTDLASAVELARGLFPPHAARRVVLVTDGAETRGNLERAAREAAVSGMVIDAVPVAGEARPDVRVVRLRASRARLHEGASLGLAADVESSLAGKGLVRLFENGVEVERRELELAVGEQASLVFRRAPDRRGLYNYRVRVEGFAGDAVAENNEAMTLVDVRGRPLLLYVEGEPEEAHYLAEAMTREGIRLDVRPPHAIPESLPELDSYDGVILSDVPAYRVSGRSMGLIRDYVEKLGGGFLMVGGKNSFGVGGYYRTPIEEILPVKIKAPDVEERYTTALVLVIDRSGSMSGHKIEICKSAAIATVELLGRKDYIGVVAFDSEARWVVPMTRAGQQRTIAGQIATINSGGGTHIYPGMVAGREGLDRVTAKVKHMIVLSDGQTEGGPYQAMAAQMLAEGLTVSTVAVGAGADAALLQAIAVAGGGKFYQTADPSMIPRIFTQDAMIHMGRLIREENFVPRQVERHPMLKGWTGGKAPALLGYVKTLRRSTTQVPLVTDLGDPLLAHWRYGLGKVTAFTSDCKSRWSALWITGWPQGYSQFWAQVLREMAREPQGRHMDIRIEEEGAHARVVVDLLETAAEFQNQAEVEADVYFVPASALGAQMRPRERLTLDQEGPGCYEGRFRPDRPGVYLVRARSGAGLVSAGLVHEVSGEAATGQVNRPLLERVCALTGGRLLSDGDEALRTARAPHARYAELAPLLVRLALLLFLADLAIRRWENVMGMWECFRGVR